MDRRSVISCRLPRGIISEIDSICENREMERSQFVYDAVISKFNRDKGVDIEELDEDLKDMIKNHEDYKKASIELEFMRQEQKKHSVAMRHLTIFDWIDTKMAEMYRNNKLTLKQETLEDMLRAYLETFRSRIENHNRKYDFIDFEKKYEYRMEDPVSYATQKLDNFRAEDK